MATKAKIAKPKKAKVEKHPGCVLRCCTLPVGSPIGISWGELNEALRGCFKLSTDLANWCVHSLFRIDTPSEAKMPEAVKKWYGYGEAAKSFPGWKDWSGAMASAQCVIRGVQRKYGQDRFAVMVKHDQKALTYRYPFPFPIHNRDWSPRYEDGGFPVVSVALPGMESRVDLRLKRRADFGRQLAMFKELVAHPERRGEAAIYKNGKSDLLVKMVGYFPRREQVDKPVHACFLHTDPGALLIAEIDGRSPWILNADHVKRRIAIHKAYRQRASEDLKREKRMDREVRADFRESLDRRCEKNNNRLNTAIHQLSAQVARFCERQKVGVVVYDDANQEYTPDGFQWFILKDRIKQKLDGIGVCFISRSDCDEKEFEGWLQDKTMVRAIALAGKRMLATINRKGSHPAISTSARSKSKPANVDS